MGDIANVLGGAFYADQYEPKEDFDPLPAGEYAVAIENAEMKTTKAQTGRYLKLELAVTDGEHAGRKIFANINIKNPNPVAEEIGLRDLAAIAQAVGIVALQDTADLLSKFMVVKVKVKPAEGQYGPSNEVRAYKSINSAPAKSKAAAPPPQSSPAAATTAAPAGNKPPWTR